MRKVKWQLNVGDIVWACAYDYASNKESKRLYQKPIKGEITHYKQDPTNLHFNLPKTLEANYFVPYKKNGRGLAWSKAVDIDSRIYTDTYEECVEIFNSLVQKNVSLHMKYIDELKDNFIDENALFDVVLYEKSLADGLTGQDVMELTSKIKGEFFPIEVSGVSSVAMGFISVEYADKLDYDTDELKAFISDILKDMKKETPEMIYHFKDGTIKIIR